MVFFARPRSLSRYTKIVSRQALAAGVDLVAIVSRKALAAGVDSISRNALASGFRHKNTAKLTGG